MLKMSKICYLHQFCAVGLVDRGGLSNRFICMSMALFVIEKSGFANKLIAQLETEIVTSTTETDCATPQGILTKPGQATGVAWDIIVTKHSTVQAHLLILLASATRIMWWVIRLSAKTQVPSINCIKQLTTENDFFRKKKFDLNTTE